MIRLSTRPTKRAFLATLFVLIASALVLQAAISVSSNSAARKAMRAQIGQAGSGKDAIGRSRFLGAEKSLAGNQKENPYLSGRNPDPLPGTPEVNEPLPAAQDQQSENSGITPSALTLTVNRTDDIAPRGVGVTCITPASTDCTLREAVIKANANAGSTINFGAGTNGVPITLSIANTGVDGTHPTGTNEDASLRGDLDVNASVTINGNGSANTIIQAGTTAANGIDKVFALNPICTTVVNVSIDSVTIRNGFNTQPFNSPDFSHTGGGIDFCAPSGAASLTITNSTISANTVNHGYGGGLDIDSSAGLTGTVTLTNDIFQNNKTTDTANLAVGAAISSRGSAQTINITDCQFIGNTTAGQVANGGAINIRQINGGAVNITGGLFSANLVGGNGGAIAVDNTDDANGATPVQTVSIAPSASNYTVIKNNVSGDVTGGTSGGGGLYINGNTLGTTTVSKAAFIGNSEATTTGTKLGGGGILVDAGNLTISFSRFAGNTNNAGSLGGSGLFKSGSDAGTVTATNNWWGCSDGPAAAPCDTAIHGAGASGTLNFTPFLRVHTTASANPIRSGVGDTSTLLARVQDSTGTDTAVANLNVFVNTNANGGSPLPIVWGAATNTVTPINTTLISSGGFAQGSGTYNGTNPVHLDPARAKIDNDFTVVGHTNVVGITVLAPPSIVKAFGAANIPINGTTTLLFTVTNPNVGDGLNGLAFSDTFPTNIVVAAVPGVINNCGGVFTAGAGAVSVSLSGGTIGINTTCTVQVTVRGTVDGTANNTSGTVTATDAGGLTGNTASASTVVANPPTITKGFGASTIPLNVNAATTLTFNISNTNTVTTLNGIVFADTLPAGLVVATPNGLSNSCTGAVTATAGSGSVSLAGSTLAAAGACTVSVNVTGTTAGVKNNSVTATSTTTGVLNSTSNASVTVVAPPTISKAFGAASIPLNGSTSLTFTINNPSATVTQNGIAFSDTLPAGLVVATPNGLTTNGNCGGGATITAVAASGSVSLSGGTVTSAAPTCTITVNVTGTTNGSKSNTTGVISSTEGGTGTTSNTTAVTVVAPPTFSKAFGAATIPVGGTTSLTFTVVNTVGNTVSQTGVAFSDTLPGGLVVATPNGLVNNGNCGAPTVTATAGSGSVTVTNGTLAIGGTCTITVNVTGSTAGVKNNTTGTISSTNGGTGSTANASIAVVAVPTIAKAFGAATIPLTQNTSLTITITNPNAVGLTGLAFSDSLVGGLVVATPNGLVNTCNGTPSAVAGSSTVSLTGGTIGASTTCSVTVNVTGTTVGVKNNTTGAVSSTESGTGLGSNTASVTVVAPMTISKAFGAATIPLNGSTSLTFTLNNPSATITQNAVAFTDTLPAGLVVATPNGQTTNGNCGGGAVITAVAASGSISLSGGTVTTGAPTCTITVNVTGTTNGDKLNTTGTISSTEGGTGATSNTATLKVVAPPTFSKGFGASQVNSGGTTSLTFTIVNTAGNTVALTGVGFTDTLPAGMVVATPNGLTNNGNCGAPTVTATAGSGSVTVSGGSVAVGNTCTITVNVTATSAGTKNNTTGTITSTNGGTGTTANASLDSCTFNVSPTSLFYPTGGGTGLVNVTTNPGTCSWTAVANDSFIHVTSGAGPTSGSGSVQFSVDPTGAPRTGTLTIAGQTVTVDQTNPTDIRLSSFDAFAAGSNTVLTWDTGLEINNLGFNVYRQIGSEKVKVNPSLIAGSALMVGGNVNLQAGLSYTWKDETYDGNAGYWLEEIDLGGNSTWHGPIGVKSSGLNNISRSRSVLLSELNSSARSGENAVIQRGYPAGFSPDQNVIGPVSSVTSGRLVTTNRPTIRTGQTSASLKNQWAIAAKSGVKLGVNKTGWYHVNVADMIAAGFNSNVDPASLQMFVNGSEIPIKVNTANPAVLSPNDSVEFFGTGLDMPTSDTQAYFLVAGSGAGKRISSQQATAAGNNGGATSFDYTVEHKERTLYFSSLLNGDAENFFGPVISPTSGPVLQKLTVHHLDQNASGQAEIEVALQGVNLVQHSVGVSLNGTTIQSISFSAMDHPVVRISVPQSALVEGDNTVSFLGGNGDVALVDYVKITYAHTYAAENNSLFATANGLLPVKIGGFSSNLIRAFDVTNSSQPTELLGTIDGDSNNFAITVSGAKRRDLLAFTPDQMLQPLSITVNHPSTLNRGGNADFLMITSKEFQSSLEPLRVLRQSQGYKVAVIDVEDIYNEFSYGVHSPSAIREFLNWTYLHWAQQPQYVLLAGSASLDPRNYEGLGNLDFVPTKLIDAGTLETASDDWLVDFNDDGLPKMAIGRLPIRTAGEATQLVNKIIAYDQSISIRQTVVLVSDLNDTGIDFTDANNAILSVIPSKFNVVNILRDDTTEAIEAATKAALIGQLRQGNRIVNYAGHGSVNLWRGKWIGGMLTDDDMLSLANTNVSPLVVSMTCLTGYFQEPRLASLGESLIKVNNGGAISAWASSGMTNVATQTTMNQAFFKQLLGNTSITIGQAIKAAKSMDIDKDVRRTWILFGDPTMRIK